jgi:uncharacterized membrane protein YsdA (DUF1294 family)
VFSLIDVVPFTAPTHCVGGHFLRDCVGTMNLIYYLLFINAVTYVLYWLDKRASMNGSWRISEYTLLMSGLAGGTLAAIAAQKRLRHKTKKGTFQFKFWAVTVIQIGVLSFQPELFAKAVHKVLG